MFKLSKTADEIESYIIRMVSEVENRIIASVERVKRNIKKGIIKLFIQSIMFMVSLAFIISGAVLFFSRFFPLDLVLLVSGAALLYVSLLFGILKNRN